MKHIAIRQTLIANKTEVATKLMKIVLFCTRVIRAKWAISNVATAKVDTKPIEISTKMCYVYANLAIAIDKAKFSCYI